MMPQDGLCLPSSINNVSFVHPQEPAFHPNPNPNPIAVAPSANPNPTGKRKRNLPGTPDPDAEVVALSPKSLMATNRFICEICNKGFQREQNLQLHRRGHNLPWKLKQRTNKDEMVKKKVFICPEKSCVHHDASRALGDLTGIKKHYSRKHGEKKWKCDKCSKKYAVMSDWKAHSKICGTREYKCDCGTIFSRKDSFITHRAFCDALAEESARVVAKAPPNFKADFNILGGSSMTNAHHQAAVNLMPHFASAAAFRSNLPPPPLTGINDHDFHVNGGGGGTISMKPTRLPLWLDQRHIMTSPNNNIITTSNASNIMETNMINIHDHDHHRCTAHDDHEIIMMCGGTGEAGGGFLASSTLAAGGSSCSADHDFITQMGPSTTCFFGTDTMHFPPRLLHLKEESDQQDHHNKTGAGGYNTASTTTSGCSPATDYCYTPQRLQAAASYSSQNLIHHMQQQSSSSSSSVNTAVGGNMSATALLQKAANIGSTRSHSSGFANSLGVVSTLCPFSNLVNFNNTRRSKDQQAVMSAAGRDRPCRKQQQDDEDLSVLMNSMPSSSSDINGDRRELLGTAGDQYPVSCSSARVQQVIMGMGNNSTATNTASGVVKRADHEDGKMSDCTNVIQGDYIDKGFDSATRDFLGLGGGGGGSSDRRAAAGGGKTPLIFQQDHHHQLPSFPNSVDLTHHFDTSK